MKIGIAYLVFLFSLTNLIVGLPELAAKLQNWIPILKTSSDLLDGMIQRVVTLLPILPDCVFCLHRLVILPQAIIFVLIVMVAMFSGMLMLNMAIAAKPGEKVRIWPARPVIWSPVIGLMLVALVASAWLTARYAEQPLGVLELLWAVFYTPAAPVKDKSIFFHTLSAYLIIVTIFYALALTIVSGSWIIFMKYIYKGDSLTQA